MEDLRIVFSFSLNFVSFGFGNVEDFVSRIGYVLQVLVNETLNTEQRRQRGIRHLKYSQFTWRYVWVVPMEDLVIFFFFFANPVHLATGIIGGYYIQDSDKIVNNMITKLKK